MGHTSADRGRLGLSESSYENGPRLPDAKYWDIVAYGSKSEVGWVRRMALYL